MEGEENVSMESTGDRMESIVQKTMDLMELLVTSDANPEKVRFAAASLAKDRELVIEWDTNKTDPLRDVLYGLCECIEYAMVWYVDREEKLLKEVKKEEMVDGENDASVGSQEKTKGITVKKEKGAEKETAKKGSKKTEVTSSGTKTMNNFFKSTKPKDPPKKIKEEPEETELPLCDVSDNEETEAPTEKKNPSIDSTTKKRHRVKEELEDEDDPMKENAPKKEKQKEKEKETTTPNKKTKAVPAGLLKWIRNADKKGK